MKKIFILCFYSSCYNQEKLVDKDKLLGNDYRLFQNSKAWTLAEAVQDKNISKIKSEVAKNTALVNYRESKFGQTSLKEQLREVNEF